MENHPYDKTVDESRQRSFEKALAILTEQPKESPGTVREIIRPKVSIGKGLLAIAVTLAIIFFLLCVLNIYVEASAIRILVASIACIGILAVNARVIIIYFIRVYQRFAPEKIRRACVFEPSCSEYMLEAIDKYGMMSGVIKGVKRLLRCHQPNGGIDAP